MKKGITFKGNTWCEESYVLDMSFGGKFKHGYILCYHTDASLWKEAAVRLIKTRNTFRQNKTIMFISVAWVEVRTKSRIACRSYYRKTSSMTNNIHLFWFRECLKGGSVSCARIVSGEKCTVPSFTVSEGVLTVWVFLGFSHVILVLTRQIIPSLFLFFSDAFIKLRGLSHVWWINNKPKVRLK